MILEHSFTKMSKGSSILIKSFVQSSNEIRHTILLTPSNQNRYLKYSICPIFPGFIINLLLLMRRFLYDYKLIVKCLQ